MIVMKFGGTSVGSPAAIRRAGEIISSRREQHPIVVVSALGGITDRLVALGSAATNQDVTLSETITGIHEKHLEVIRELGLDKNDELLSTVESVVSGCRRVCEKLSGAPRDEKALKDELMSSGEFLSANILSAYLNSAGVGASVADAREILVTDSQFGKAQPIIEESAPLAEKILLPLAEKNMVPVMQGFVGREKEGRVTTLGRGGSDYTATLIGAMLDVDAVEIWSDVDGVMTANPSMVSSARRIRVMSFREAAELAYFGAKVLHPSTLLPAIDKGIPVYVLNSIRPQDSGTKIARVTNGNDSGCIVKSIAFKEGLTVITVTSTRMLMSYGYISSIFEIFNRYETSVDLVSTSEVSVSMTIDNTDHLEDIVADLNQFAGVEVNHQKAIVCLVGEQMKTTPGMPGKIFSLLEDIPIHLISQGASEINISFVIDEPDVPKVLDRLHARFFCGPLNPDVFAVSE